MANILRRPNLTPDDEVIVVRLFERPEPLRFAEGGLAQAAQAVQGAGRAGDDILLHVNKHEFAQLQKEWGEPSINPETGLYEYGFFSKLWKKIKSVAKVVLPIALNFIPGVGPALAWATKGIAGALSLGATGTAIVGKALTGALSGAISGGGKGALMGAVTGGLSGKAGAIGSKVTGALGLGSSALANAPAGTNAIGSGLIGGAASSLTGGSFADGLKSGALSSVAAPMIQNAIAGTGLGQKLGVQSSSSPTLMDALKPDPLANNADVQAMANNAQSGVASALGTPDASAAGAGASAGNSLADLAKKYALPALLLQSVTSKQPDQTPPETQLPPGFLDHLPQLNFNRTRTDPLDNYYTYGMGNEQNFFNQNNLPSTQSPVGAARGGNPQQQLVRGPGTGRSDDIPAKLSDGEYVMDAETVALLGDGSIDAGARKLDELRKKLRMHKGKKLSQGKFSDPAGEPEQYLQGAQ